MYASSRFKINRLFSLLFLRERGWIPGNQTFVPAVLRNPGVPGNLARERKGVFKFVLWDPKWFFPGKYGGSKISRDSMGYPGGSGDNFNGFRETFNFNEGG